MYGLETLLKWIRTHGVADARIVGDAVRIGIHWHMVDDPAICGTDLVFVWSVDQARTTLGY